MKSFIATAPAAYRSLIGAALSIAIEDARRDAKRRAAGEEPTVAGILHEGAEEGNLLIAIVPMPEDEPFGEFLSTIEDRLLAGHYDPAASTPGMKQAVAAFRRATVDGIPTIAGRRVVASSVEGMIGGQDDDKVINYPVVICDDGSAFRLRNDGEWRPIRPVPGTPAGLEFQARVAAANITEE